MTKIISSQLVESVLGYCLGIRSERRLCEEVHLNLAYRWFCRLGLDDAVPDHSTFSKNRHGRFRDSEALRHVFESVLRRCMTEGLVAGEGFAIDASVIKADANRARGISGTEDIDWRQGERQSRALRDYLEALEETNPTDSDGNTPASPEPITPAKNISLTDPAARWTAAPGGPAFYAYSTNYLIDLQAGIIVDVEATPAYRSQEVASTKVMVDRVAQRFALKPRWLVGENPRTRITKADTIIYRSSQSDCTSCAQKGQCCPNTPTRKIARSIHEAERNVARAIAATPEYRQSRCDRKKVEMLFAHLKRILKLDRLRLRGLSGAQDEFLLAATAQNLRRMAKWLVPSDKKAKKCPLEGI